MSREEQAPAWEAAKALYEVSQALMKSDTFLQVEWWIDSAPYKHEWVDSVFTGLGFTDSRTNHELATVAGNVTGLETLLLKAREIIFGMPEHPELFFVKTTVLCALDVIQSPFLFIDGMPLIYADSEPPDQILLKFERLLQALLRRSDADLARSTMILKLIAEEGAPESYKPIPSRELTADNLRFIFDRIDDRTVKKAAAKLSQTGRPVVLTQARNRYVIDTNLLSVDQRRRYETLVIPTPNG